MMKHQMKPLLLFSVLMVLICQSDGMHAVDVDINEASISLTLYADLVKFMNTYVTYVKMV